MTNIGGSAGGISSGSSTIVIPSFSQAGVIQAISAITLELPSIQKNDSGDGVKYKFRGIETLIGHLSPLLAKHGVVIVPRTRIVEIRTMVENSQGQMKGWTETVLEVTWRIYGPDGSSVEAITVGIGRDNSDKGSNKAQTQAFKYLLMELFAIGDKDEDGDAFPPSGRPEALIDADTANMVVGHIQQLEAGVKAEVAKKLEALTGTRKPGEMKASDLGPIMSILLNAKDDSFKATR